MVFSGTASHVTPSYKLGCLGTEAREILSSPPFVPIGFRLSPISHNWPFLYRGQASTRVEDSWRRVEESSNSYSRLTANSHSLSSSNPINFEHVHTFVERLFQLFDLLTLVQNSRPNLVTQLGWPVPLASFNTGSESHTVMITWCLSFPIPAFIFVKEKKVGGGEGWGGVGHWSS